MYRGIQCRPLVDMDVDDEDGVAASIHFKKDSEHDDGNTCVFSILMERNHNCLNSNVGSQLVGLSGETVHYNGWPGG